MHHAAQRACPAKSLRRCPGIACLLPKCLTCVNELYQHLETPEVLIQRLIPRFMAGFLPFSAIYIELHYIFASLWGHKIYTLFGILFLAFVMLVIACLHSPIDDLILLSI
mmetsp:Transcript_9706/g.31688  ORF Transcript_9706/g.31688 Transcript_9706/m.31688 type:complete len:110 (-) Transcript_9706:483-812(-)